MDCAIVEQQVQIGIQPGGDRRGSVAPVFGDLLLVELPIVDSNDRQRVGLPARLGDTGRKFLAQLVGVERHTDTWHVLGRENDPLNPPPNLCLVFDGYVLYFADL